MKSLVFTVLTLTSIAASALNEVTYDPNDALPSDYLRYNQEVRTKTVTHTNGQNYAIMYTNVNNGSGNSTNIVGLCNIGYKDTVERCLQDTDPVLRDVYNAVIQKSKPDCGKIAMLNQDHLKTLQRISDYNSTARQRDIESNARALMPIAASLTWQVETLNSLVPSVNSAETVRLTKQLMDDVSNKRLRPDQAVMYLSQQISTVKKDFVTLLGASRCTNEDLRMCRFNKQTGELLTPELNQESYAKYIDIERKGLVEMRACSTAKAAAAPVIPQTPKAPEITPPTIKLPAQSVEPQAVDPTIAK